MSSVFIVPQESFKFNDTESSVKKYVCASDIVMKNKHNRSEMVGVLGPFEALPYYKHIYIYIYIYISIDGKLVFWH
jgi:hypothetical protein